MWNNTYILLRVKMGDIIRENYQCGCTYKRSMTYYM